jgi:hypothetical protein
MSLLSLKLSVCNYGCLNEKSSGLLCPGSEVLHEKGILHEQVSIVLVIEWDIMDTCSLCLHERTFICLRTYRSSSETNILKALLGCKWSLKTKEHYSWTALKIFSLTKTNVWMYQDVAQRNSNDYNSVFGPCKDCWATETAVLSNTRTQQQNNGVMQPVYRQQLSKHVPTRNNGNCLSGRILELVARQQSARQWTRWVAITWFVFSAWSVWSLYNEDPL